MTHLIDPPHLSPIVFIYMTYQDANERQTVMVSQYEARLVSTRLDSRPILRLPSSPLCIVFICINI